jgi:hypothetical protein
MKGGASEISRCPRVNFAASEISALKSFAAEKNVEPCGGQSQGRSLPSQHLGWLTTAVSFTRGSAVLAAAWPFELGAESWRCRMRVLSAFKGGLYGFLSSFAQIHSFLSKILFSLRQPSVLVFAHFCQMLRSLPNLGNMQALQVLPRKYVPFLVQAPSFICAA